MDSGIGALLSSIQAIVIAGFALFSLFLLILLKLKIFKSFSSRASVFLYSLTSALIALLFLFVNILYDEWGIRMVLWVWLLPMTVALLATIFALFAMGHSGTVYYED